MSEQNPVCIHWFEFPLLIGMLFAVNSLEEFDKLARETAAKKDRTFIGSTAADLRGCLRRSEWHLPLWLQHRHAREEQIEFIDNCIPVESGDEENIAQLRKVLASMTDEEYGNCLSKKI